MTPFITVLYTPYLEKINKKTSIEFVIHALENINRDLVILGISDTHNKLKRNSPCMHTFKLILR